MVLRRRRHAGHNEQRLRELLFNLLWGMVETRWKPVHFVQYVSMKMSHFSKNQENVSQCHLLTRVIFNWLLRLSFFINWSVLITQLLCALYSGMFSCLCLWMKLLLFLFTTDANSWSPQNNSSSPNPGSGRTLKPERTESYRAASILLIKMIRSP